MFVKKVSWNVLIGLMMVAAVLIACALVAPQAPTSSGGAQPVAQTWQYAVVPPVVHPFYGPFPGAIAHAEKVYKLGKVEYQLPQNFV